MIEATKLAIEIVDHQLEVGWGEHSSQLSQAWRNPALHHGRRHSERQLIARQAQLSEASLQVRQSSINMNTQRLTCWRQRNQVVASSKQRSRQLILQQTDLTRDRGLRHAKRLGGRSGKHRTHLAQRFRLGSGA